tara:strand:+ start:413 stop:1321 length:909 start_codon:yes stop_codon:yes gene_type:complete
MIVNKIIEQVEFKRQRGIVFAAGGAGDIILAKNIGKNLIERGCSQVDLAQPLNCRTLSEKDLLGEAGEFYALKPEQGLDSESVLRHFANIPCENHSVKRKAKGLSISSSLEWGHGARYVCAAHGDGLSLLAARKEGCDSFYDFAIGVDGGGDVLTHDKEEFDCIVLDSFTSAWDTTLPLILVAMGLGADGGSTPSDFQDVSLDGWLQLMSASVDDDFVESLKIELESLDLWHPHPSEWNKNDPHWGYGLKVAQIIALAVKNKFPFDSMEKDSNLVVFPRRRELKLMDKRLLCEARMFLYQGG